MNRICDTVPHHNTDPGIRTVIGEDDVHDVSGSRGIHKLDPHVGDASCCRAGLLDRTILSIAGCLTTKATERHESRRKRAEW
jgi:hypothetical protein